MFNHSGLFIRRPLGHAMLACYARMSFARVFIKIAVDCRGEQAYVSGGMTTTNEREPQSFCTHLRASTRHAREASWRLTRVCLCPANSPRRPPFRWNPRDEGTADECIAVVCVE